MKILMIALFLTSRAYALDLDTARAKGLVGETHNGQIEALSGTPDAETQKLIQEINAKRKQAYQDLSKQNGQSIEVIQKLAGEKMRAKVEKGQYFKGESGDWEKK